MSGAKHLAHNATRGGSFDGLIVKHKRQKDAMEELLFLLDHGHGYELIMLVGPTGTGKSTLAGKLKDHLVERERALMADDPEYVPVIATTALASGYRSFDWKALYRKGLSTLGDPFADVRKPCREAALARNKLTGESATASELRQVLEHELQYRKTKYWLIDEAQHILLGAKAGGPGDQFDVLKSLAQAAGIKLVLIGTYQLVQHVQCSAQLARRGEAVHLGRYRPELKEDRNSFASCVATMLRAAPVDAYPSVTENFDFYYVGSAGCIGILKDWLARALSRAAMGGRRLLTLDDLRDCRLRQPAIAKIMKDLLSGEQAMLIGDDDSLAELVLGGDLLANGSTRSLLKSNKSLRQKPGIRSPVRDPVVGSTELDLGVRHE